MDRLMFALLTDSIAEVRRVPSRCGETRPLQAETLRKHFSVWERGVLLNAACFLIDLPRLPLDVPLGAFTWAHAILDAERRCGHVVDLVAASMGGGPWRPKLRSTCLVCGRLGTWRPVLPSVGLPVEAAWRYQRPENHLPLCRRCVARNAFRKPESQYDLAAALWGPRFVALDLWHRARVEDRLPPDWDPGSDPLWPAGYGGETWAQGSGSVRCAEPRGFYGIARTETQRADLERFLGRKLAADLVGQEPQPLNADHPLPRVEAAAGELVGAHP